MTTPDEAIPDCKLCAACCFSDQDRYILVTGYDHSRLGRHEQRTLVEFEGNLCWMKMKDGHCIALVPSGEEWLCSIYERRPELCRDYERGGSACEVDRERFGPSSRAKPPGS
jgi:Fe-S-cluster containining protein